MINKICVAGAGTMGCGIALAAAQNNFTTVLFDTNAAGIEKAKETIDSNLQYLLSKNKISFAEKENIYAAILFTTNVEECHGDLIIEAIIENLEIKTILYKKLAEINSSKTIFASNTSSLSVTDIQKDILHPGRVCGMHFFNPANVMKLVEVVAGKETTDETIDTIVNVCGVLKKQPVVCKDAPGFIVNRVARHFYLEALFLAYEKKINFEDIDTLMENAGFKMGPFKLMDLIGMDINLAVSQSVYAAFNHLPRFKPSPLQEQKVAAGELGKKTGKGFYEYPQKNIQ